MPMVLTIAELARALGPVFTTAEAVAAGISKNDLARAVTQDDLIRLYRGIHTSRRVWLDQDARGRHTLKVLAHQRLRPDTVACSVSAAVLLGLPIPEGEPPEQVYSTLARQTPGHGEMGVKADATVRRSWLRSQDVVKLKNGIRVTGVPRTVWDCARHWPRPWALAVADAAVAGHRLDPGTLQERIAEQVSAPGSGRAEWAAAHARPGIESPLESLARATLILAGLPEPEPQISVVTRLGTFRVDLLDEVHRIVTEADGKLKYQTGEDVWAEKRREDALRETGLRVVRFTMHEYHHPDEWLANYTDLIRRHKRP
jgi:hypothetical protein